jgi:cation diffusion facilitator CzcD-associated flavoprotein CzcO
MLPHLTDAEIDDICAGLTQSAAKVRFLQRLGLPVQRKPNGRPLVRRADWERQTGQTANTATKGPRWTVPA